MASAAYLIVGAGIFAFGMLAGWASLLFFLWMMQREEATDGPHGMPHDPPHHPDGEETTGWAPPVIAGAAHGPAGGPGIPAPSGLGGLEDP